MTARVPLSARHLALTVVVLLLAGALAAPASASTFESRTYRVPVYEAVDSNGIQECILPGAETTFRLTLWNTGQAGQQLGSANVTPGFPIRLAANQTTVTVTSSTDVVLRTLSNTSRTTYVSVAGGSTLQLRDLGVAVGERVTVEFTGTPPATGAFETTYPLVDGSSIIVRQANNFRGGGNDLFLRGAEPSITVGGVCTLTAFVDLEDFGDNVETCVIGVDECDEVVLEDGDGNLVLAVQVSGEGSGGLLVGVGGVSDSDGDCVEPTLPGNQTLRRLPEGLETTLIGVGSFTSKTAVFRLPPDVGVGDPNFGMSQYEVCAQPIQPESQFSLFGDKFSGEEVGLGEWGWLPDCSAAGDRPPCVSSKERIDGFPTITLRWGSGARLK
jgi:hypothetical protein